MSSPGQLSFRPGLRRLRRDESGAALLEMAVVTPFLLIFGFGVIEFGNALYQYHLITAGVRDAGRFAASLPEGDPDEVTCESPSTTPVGCAKTLALYGAIENDGPKRVGWWDIEDIEITYSNIANTELGGGLMSYRGGAQITVVRVSTTATYEGLGLLSYYGIGSFDITTAHEERHYGVR